MNHDEGGEGAPLSGLVRLVQGLPLRPRRRGLFGSEYERFMGARRPNSAQLFALADHLRGGGPGGGVASKRPIDAADGIAAAAVGGDGPAAEVLRPVDVMTAQRPIKRAALSPIPDRLTRHANGTMAGGSLYFLPIVDRPNQLSRSVPKAETALDYLSASPVARDAIAGMTVRRVPTNIVSDPKEAQTHGLPDGSAYIDWDPNAALVSQSNGKAQSPALMWFHEMDHALNFLSDPPAWRRRAKAKTFDDYDYREERRVIDGSERAVALQLGEPTRRNHRGEWRPAATPIANGRLPRR
jgi:hypothetical protein